MAYSPRACSNGAPQHVRTGVPAFLNLAFFYLTGVFKNVHILNTLLSQQRDRKT